MKTGKLFVIEGASDGMWKSTQIAKLRTHLKSEGYLVASHHFPSYGTYQGALVEKYLMGDYGEIKDLTPYFINSLYAIDRAISYLIELKELYQRGDILLLDRYTTSSLIYQGAMIDNIDEKKKFIDYVIDFEYQKLGVKEPDEVIFLMAPLDLITKMRTNRKNNEGIENDLHERDLDFMKKVYENAMFIADYLNWNKVECSSGEKMLTIDEIHNKVYRLVKKKL